jgi:hypothetical protein
MGALEGTQLLMWLGINFGFAAIVCIVLLVMYQKLVNILSDIIKGNTTAMTELRGVIAAVCDRLDRLEGQGGNRR